MRLYIDSANVEQIGHLNEYYPIAGVTTNPSILVKENRPFLEVLKEIREVKIPVTEEGLKAIKILSEENIPVLATTIYTSFQALMAALAGAKYVAPYVNRIDNLTGNGVKVVSEIAQLFESYQLSTEILAASFKNVQQIHDVCLAGAETVTVSPDLILKFIAFPSTASDVAVFKKEWQKAYGADLIHA